MDSTKRYFFCGIGGSGMFPLATIVRARGADVAGSDRALDQGRSGGKFDWLRGQGIALFDQDGSGVTAAEQIIVASGAIEASVPDIARATALGCARMTRAELNAALFNGATDRVGIAGTSGKSTVTGMIAWILTRAGGGHDWRAEVSPERADELHSASLPKSSADSIRWQPTVMNGAVMRNFAGLENPYASALPGDPATYVSEVDESDGSIALYAPTVAVVTNISLDHKSLDELHALFGDFLRKAGAAIINADDPESAALRGAGRVSFGFADGADVRCESYVTEPYGCRYSIAVGGSRHDGTLRMPGRHNVANALAAIAATRALGIPVTESVAALNDFAGLARRYEVIGTANGVTVIDDFAHNPDKMAATLAAATALPGRLLLFFQPHGYGPLRQMGHELAASFAAGMRSDDQLFVCDPVYFGGTVDRSVGSEVLVDAIVAGGAQAVHIPAREACGEAILAAAQPGDRIIILGARDDTLTDFAQALLAAL
jgi:UDP-N-acetylmuramate--alanine ligase